MVQKFDANNLEAEVPSSPRKQPGGGRKVTDEEFAEWKRLREEGWSLKKIAEKFERQQSFIYQKLKKAGVGPPPKQKKVKSMDAKAGKAILPKGDKWKPKKVATTLPKAAQPLNPLANKPRNLAELLNKQIAEKKNAEAVEVIKDTNEKQEQKDVTPDNEGS